MKIKEVQDRTYELLCVIDDICRKENIPYSLEGGAAIGAVREKDLIPWDDDVDIKVRAENYPAFREAMIRNLPEHYRLVEPQEFAPHFFDMTIPILDDRYLLRKETEEDRFYKNLQNRVGIDVFLEFFVPNSALRRKLVFTRLNLIYGLGMGHRHHIEYEKHSLVEKAGIILMSTAGKCLPVPWIVRHMYRVIRKYNSHPTDWEMRTWLFPEYIQPYAWHKDITYSGEIRGRKFPLSVGWHEELTQAFGDYMTPPKDRSVYNQHLDEEDRYRDGRETGKRED